MNNTKIKNITKAHSMCKELGRRRFTLTSDSWLDRKINHFSQILRSVEHRGETAPHNPAEPDRWMSPGCHHLPERGLASGSRPRKQDHWGREGWAIGADLRAAHCACPWEREAPGKVVMAGPPQCGICFQELPGSHSKHPRKRASCLCQGEEEGNHFAMHQSTCVLLNTVSSQEKLVN